MIEKNTKHQSVLLKEVIKALEIKDNEIFVDATLGNAGHSKSILESGVTNLTIIGIDADQIAIETSKEVLAPFESKHLIYFETTYFDSLDKILAKHQINHIDKILFDLGFRSEQVDQSERGFSFLKNGPLDMSFQSSKNISQRENQLTASEIVNEWQEESLADIIYGFGEERFSRRIAKAIVKARDDQKIETTFQLAEIIKKTVPIFYQRSKIHPATKTFQALRIAVNSELERLQKTLEIAFENLSPNGRIVVISFHSLEDRIVKRFFKEKSKEKLARLIIKKPITPLTKEIKENPRSRSSKLRILEKI